MLDATVGADFPEGPRVDGTSSDKPTSPLRLDASVALHGQSQSQLVESSCRTPPRFTSERETGSHFKAEPSQNPSVLPMEQSHGITIAKGTGGLSSVGLDSRNSSATKMSVANGSAMGQTASARVFLCDGSGGSTGGCGEECNPGAGNDFTFRLTSALLQLQCQLGVLEDIVTATERGRFGR